MEGALKVMLAITLGAVLLILAAGVGSFIAGGEFNRKYANTLMRLRVGSQAVAVILLLALLILKGFVDLD